MNVISLDVAWKEGKKRNAVAMAGDKNQIYFLAGGLGDSELTSLVQGNVRPGTLILLDIPIEGCQNLVQGFRPVELGLQHHIALYPSAMAGVRGLELKKKLLQAMPEDTGVIIQEIYPHAIYKFLWVAKEKGKLESVRQGDRGKILDESFTPLLSPPKYKGRKKGFNKQKRLIGMDELYHLLAQYLGLGFLTPPGFPDSSSNITRLELLADEFDACLGAVLGLYCAAHNPYVWLAGNQSQGEILIFADSWLKERLQRGGIKMRRIHSGPKDSNF